MEHMLDTVWRYRISTVYIVLWLMLLFLVAQSRGAERMGPCCFGG